MPTDEVKVAFDDRLRANVVEWVDDKGALVSCGHRLYSVAEVGPPAAVDLLFALPLGIARAFTASWRPAQRLTRSIFYNVYRLPDGSVFFSFGRSMGVWRNGDITWLTGAVQPMRCLRGAIAMLADGTLYLGEYVGNPDRSAVRIYCLPAGTTHLEVIYEFPPGAVRHVHGLYLQPGSERIWCTTGDVGLECRILVTEDGFKAVDTVGSGDESWRAVSIAFLNSTILYGTDSEFVQNRIYVLDSRTGVRRILGDVDGPVYYCAPVGPNLLFSVTAEGCRSQPLNQGTLWLVSESLRIQRLASYPKDAWPRYFMFGTFHFALGPGRFPNDPRAYAHLHGLAGPDGRTLVVTAEN